MLGHVESTLFALRQFQPQNRLLVLHASDRTALADMLYIKPHCSNCLVHLIHGFIKTSNIVHIYVILFKHVH